VNEKFENENENINRNNINDHCSVMNNVGYDVGYVNDCNKQNFCSIYESNCEEIVHHLTNIGDICHNNNNNNNHNNNKLQQTNSNLLQQIIKIIRQHKLNGNQFFKWTQNELQTNLKIDSNIAYHLISFREMIKSNLNTVSYNRIRNNNSNVLSCSLLNETPFMSPLYLDNTMCDNNSINHLYMNNSDMSMSFRFQNTNFYDCNSNSTNIGENSSVNNNFSNLNNHNHCNNYNNCCNHVNNSMINNHDHNYNGFNMNNEILFDSFMNENSCSHSICNNESIMINNHNINDLDNLQSLNKQISNSSTSTTHSLSMHTSTMIASPTPISFESNKCFRMENPFFDNNYTYNYNSNNNENAKNDDSTLMKPLPLPLSLSSTFFSSPPPQFY